MGFPPELIEEIIGHIPPYYTQFIRTCSLVATSWIYPSQKRLFETIDIHPGNLQSWLDGISPTSTTLLGHIRLLCYHEKEYTIYPAERVIGPAHHVLRDYFPSFRQLKSFTISSAHVPWQPQQIELFSAFQGTLSQISLSDCVVTKSTLITLINHFPNLSSLYLCRLTYDKECEPSFSLSRLRLKKLYVTEWSGDRLDLLNELSGLGLNFEEVVLHSVALTPTWPEFSKHVIDSFGESAEYMRMIGYPQDDEGFLTLSHCQELCEVELFAPRMNDAELALIASITSAKITRIILTCSPAFRFSPSEAYWTQLDDILVGLANQSECKVEVEFRSVRVDGGSDLRRYLPAFRRKGQVVVLDTKCELIHCSG